MSMPDKLTRFAVYENGNDMIGVADVVLPDLSPMTESIKGAGINGEIDSPAVGQFGSLTATINWRNMLKGTIGFAAPKARMLSFMGSVQSYNEGTGEYEHTQVVITMRCIPKKFTPGKFDVSTGMGTSAEVEILYLKISIDGKEAIELDKLNDVFIVDGVDYLEQVRKNIGKS